jgi:hypothetical protein
MDGGWIKLWRKSIDSQVFQDRDLWKVWSWCLMKATHSQIWIPVKTGVGSTEVELMPGQFIFGRFEGAKELKMKPSSVRNRMEKLKNIGNLDIQPDTHFSIISINNWGTYQHMDNGTGQATGQPEDNHRTTTGQPQDTNKNVKNVKNVKNNTYSEVFLNFWDKYPNKKGKPEAFKAWQKFKPDILVLLNAIKAQKQEKVELQQARKFCPEWPNASTWLNQRRWEDEIEIQKQDDQYSHFEIVGAKNGKTD